ncbi:hypothetical protein [Nocardia bhagyanarayanae]|uniref:DUF8020 domain-containing protein n=1 Tax=Nocardia bhagyanarayanae TaxID=1215925 RepID=A0A543FB00_9NOCA|nr:hypothetical protein [Nocardia bhagyanarayanae]TQM30994.1 hypothetical protein FB390_2633 [Nocardia bhagyanarayanae]
MKFGMLATTTLLTAAVVGLAAGTVHANPTEQQEVSASGVDQGVGYRTVLSDASRIVTTTVDSGRFEIAEGGAKVVLKSDRGEVVTDVPLTYELSGHRLSVANEISEDGRKLKLTPTVDAKAIGEMQPVDSQARLATEINKNVVGLVAGGVLGGLIGAVLGLGFFSIITGPIGAVVGAIAGGYIMGGQPFMDAMSAAISGQP